MALGTRIKANNTNALNLTTSWTSSIVPDSNYIGYWEGTYQAGTGTLALGASASWAGIGVQNPGSDVNIGTTTATLTLGADGIDMSSATRDLSILSPVSVALGANQTWYVASGRTLTVNSTLSGSGTLNKAFPGALILTGASNTNSGALTVSSGDIWCLKSNTGTPNQLNAVASITLSGGNVLWTGASANNFTKNISGSNNVFAGNADFTFSGNLSSFNGTFYQYSSSYDSVTPTNTKTTFNAASAFPASASLIGYRQNSTSPTMTIAYTGSGNVSTTGNWNFFNFTGGTGAWTAVLQHYGTSGATFTIGGTSKTISAAGSYNLTWQLDVSSTGALSVNLPIGQTSSGVLSLQKLGTGPATLAGANTFTGTVVVSAGTLNANSATALGAASSTAAISVTSGATLSLGAALNYNSPGRTTTISGTGVSTGGALVHAFAGTANVGTINLGNAAYIRGTASGTSILSSSITNGGFALTAGAASGNTLTLTGGISGTGNLVVGNSSSDTGTVSLPTANTYSSSTRLAYGTLLLGHASALPSSSILVFQAGTLDASIPLTITNTIGDTYFINFGGSASVTLTSSIGGLLPDNLTVTTNGSVGVLTLSGIISRDNASYGFIKAGPNTLCLKGINTYTNVTSLQAGTLQLGHPQTVASSFRVDITQASAKLQTLSTSGQVGQNGKATIQELYNPYGGTIKIGG